MKEDWGEAGWEWLRSRACKDEDTSPDGKRVFPRYWNDPRFGAAQRGIPVVGVTWYEANAYCRWLQRHWSDLEEGEANPGCQPALVRLPAEAEWGRTAGGEQPQERYPWDAPGQATQEQSEILKRANMGENGISHTTPVGMYPEGQGKPFRLWDLAGNVWEWQANLFNKDHDFLALRGGSW